MSEPVGSVVATREGLRQATLEGIEWALAHPWLAGLNADNRRLLEAQRTFWRQADDAALDRLLAAY
jgi:hypothetical protein